MKEGVQISEEAIKLLARGAKNLAALLYALAKDQKKLYGKVNMNRLLSEQRPIEVLPLAIFPHNRSSRRKGLSCAVNASMSALSGSDGCSRRSAYNSLRRSTIICISFDNASDSISNSGFVSMVILFAAA